MDPENSKERGTSKNCDCGCGCCDKCRPVKYKERVHTVIQCSGCGGLISTAECPKSFIGSKCGCGGRYLEIPYDERKPQWMFSSDNVLACNECELLSSLTDPKTEHGTLCLNCVFCKGVRYITRFKWVSDNKIQDETGIIQCNKCKHLWSQTKYGMDMVNNSCACGGKLEYIKFWKRPDGLSVV